MAVTYTSVALISQTGGNPSTGSITVAPNTKEMIFAIALDNTNNATNNVAPSVVSWNGINATFVDRTVTDAGSPFGQCLWLYKIDNPTPGTGTATVNHATQYHNQIVINAVCATNPLTLNFSKNTFRGTGTSASVSTLSGVGNDTLFIVAVDALKSTDLVTVGGSTLLAEDGGSSRQLLRVSKGASSGLTNSESYTLATSQRWAAFAIDIAEGVIQVDSINGSSSNPTINIGTSNTVNTTGLGTIVGATLTDANGFVSTLSHSMPSGDGTCIAGFPYADGSTQAVFGNVTFSCNDGVKQASLTGQTSVPSGYLEQTWLYAYYLSPSHLGSVLTLVDGNKVYYEDVDGLRFAANGEITLGIGVTSLTTTIMLHDVTTGLITNKTINITVEGGVVVSINFIQKLNTSKLPIKKLPSRKL